VRAGRTIALAGALISPPLLIADLHTPQRWYNMVRIFRKTSAMSIGSWALSAFGIMSGFTWVGQAIEDLFGWKFGRWIARLFSLPAALSGGVVAIYTGTLLAATATPLWSSAFPYLSSLFASSAASTAAAALSLAAAWKGMNERTRRRLEWFSLISGTAELFFAATIQRCWRKETVDQPLSKPPLGPAWYAGVLGLATGGPLIIHAWQAIRKHPSKQLSILAAIAMLLGGFILRAVFVFGGRKSYRLPRDYFRNAQPHDRVNRQGNGK
jgi:formate-dependent nitrite reductase membrane component NrfD